MTTNSRNYCPCGSPTSTSFNNFGLQNKKFLKIVVRTLYAAYHTCVQLKVVEKANLFHFCANMILKKKKSRRRSEPHRFRFKAPCPQLLLFFNSCQDSLTHKLFFIFFFNNLWNLSIEGLELEKKNVGDIINNLKTNKFI